MKTSFIARTVEVCRTPPSLKVSGSDIAKSVAVRAAAKEG